MNTSKDIPSYYPEQNLPSQSSFTFSSPRLKLVAGLFFAILAVILSRAVFILTNPPSADILQNLAKRQYTRSINLSPYRGTIFDRRSEPLAISIRKPSIFVNPKVFSPSANELAQLSRILHLPKSALRKIAQKDTYFYWLKRKVAPEVESQIKKLALAGVHSVLEPSRYYPSQLASQLIGYVGIDDKGLLGLERYYDHILRGNHSDSIIGRDAKGRMIISRSASAAPQKSGQRVYLSIDRVIQEISEKALAEGVQHAQAKSGFVIVSDPHSGHILAVANYPNFDPNNSKTITPQNSRNYALLDLFEPGSVVKPLIAGKAIDRRLTSLQEVFELDHGVYREENWRIRDTHAHETLSTLEIISKSSNIGAYKIARRLGEEAVYKAYQDFGVGDAELSLGLTHQAFGRMLPWQKWRKIRFANISFGQGFLVSGIEIVQAFGSIANGGQLMKPILVTKIAGDAGEVSMTQAPQVIRRALTLKTSQKLRKALAEVVVNGTGGNAASELYSVAGKTGTTEKIDPDTKAYSTELRIASFAGFTPVDDPHLVIYVVIDEPSIKPYYGGTWAAPVFKSIAELSLKYLNVAPDLTTGSTTLSQKESNSKL